MIIPLTPLRFLRYSSQQFPRRTAVVCGDQRFTYAQFSDRTARQAGALRSLGISPASALHFLAPTAIACWKVITAYWKPAACCFRSIFAWHRRSWHTFSTIQKPMCFSLKSSSFRWLSPSADDLRSVKHFVPLDFKPSQPWMATKNYEEMLAAATPYRADVMQIDENSVAELFYTSGTSANPKGVMLTHRNIYLHALNVAIAFGSKS